MRLACLSCATLPRGFVGSLEGFGIPGVWESNMSCVKCTQSCVAKNWMSVCRVCSVGFCKAMMSTVSLLSLQMGVGSVCLKPNSDRTKRMHLAVFVAVTAAMNLASVKLWAVGDCVPALHATAPPERANTHPVVKHLFTRSFAHATLTNPISLLERWVQDVVAAHPQSVCFQAALIWPVQHLGVVTNVWDDLCDSI